MLSDEPVTNIMSTDLKTVQIGEKLSEVRARMADHGIHHVPIAAGDRLGGIVGAVDLMKRSFAAYAGDEQAGPYTTYARDQSFDIRDAMQSQIISIAESDSVQRAAELLADGRFHSLPVLDGARKLVGIITSTDLIQYLLDQY